MQESLRLRATQTPIIPVIADLIRTTPGTLSLGQGVVSYGPPPSALAAIEQFLADPANHKYQPVDGVPRLRAAIEAKLARENSYALSAGHRLMVTAGGNMAFMNAILAIADPGDEIILPTPYYFNQEMAVTMANCRPVLVGTDANYQLRIEALRAAITPRTRAIVTVSPNNPTGAVYPETAVRAVNALCAERGILHIHDEAYAAFTFGSARHFSPGAIAGSAAHTITLHSMSKAYGFASWRIGWMVYPAELEPALRKVQDTLIICPPAIAQFAAAGAIEGGADYVRAKLGDLAGVRRRVQEALAGLADVCDVPPAEGAFYYLIRVHTEMTAMDAAARLIRRHQVAVVPGNAFGLETGCHLRISFGALSEKTAAEALERLGRGIREMV